MRNRWHPPFGVLVLAAVLAVAAAGWRVVASEAGGTELRASVLTWSPPSESADPPVLLPGAGEPVHLVEEDVPGTWVLAGRVIDDLGRPLPGAIVRVGARQAAADDAGRFALAGLPPLEKGARLTAIAHADWYASERVELRGPIAPGDATPPQEFRLGRGASLAGHVLRADGSAVAGARIVAQSDHGRRPQPREPFVADEQCTGWDGRFLFECVQGGDWTVTAELGGLVGCRLQLSVAAGDAVTCAPLVLAQTATLDGRVLDRSGAPVPRAEVRLQWLGEDEQAAALPAPPRDPGVPDDDAPRPIINVPFPRSTSADGSFHAEDLAPGMWRIVAIPPPGVLGPMPCGARAHLAGGDAATLDLRLAEPRRVHGVLLDPAGLPVAGLDVTAEEQAPFNWRRVPPTVRTDALGRFVLDVAPAAEVCLTAEWQVRHLGATACIQPGAEEPVRLQLVSLAFWEAACSLSIPSSSAGAGAP